MTRLGAWVSGHARRVLLVALVVVLAGGVFGGPVVGMLSDDGDFEDPAAEAVQAVRTLQDATGVSAGPRLIALVDLGAPFERPEAQARLARVVRIVEGDPAVAAVASPQAGGETARGLVSEDRRTAFVGASFDTRADWGEAAERLEARLTAVPGVAVGGAELAGEQVGTQVQEDLARAELLAFPILFALSLVVFRGFVAALLPLAVGMATILITFALVRLVNEVAPVSIFAINLITGLGLGLAIDYSLFMVSRFREELAKGASTPEAVITTYRTAGRTVLFSALTVAAALAALLVFPLDFLSSMGIGGALVALTAALVSLTLLPALLAALGPRVDALSLRRRRARPDATGPWYRLSHAVMRRPLPVALAAAGVLVVAGLPFLRAEFGGIDASALPESASARQVSDTLRADFPLDRTAPVVDTSTSPLLVVARTTDAAAVESYARRLERIEGVRDAAPAGASAGGIWRVDVYPAADGVSARSKAVLREVRAAPAPFEVLVGGDVADNEDLLGSLGDHLPIALALIAATTFALLFALTGSLILPLKTLVMNVLTVSVAFGVLVLIFQDGRLEGVLGYESNGTLEATQPVLLFAVAFGLSTDYGVFLLTRIKEARDGGLNDREAVAVGLQRTGRIVTFAALLFCIAIGAFATSEISFIKQVGLGTAVAVLVDATIVRGLLVPALMALLGRWNWWAPRPLARLHDRLGLREAHA